MKNPSTTVRWWLRRLVSGACLAFAAFLPVVVYGQNAPLRSNEIADQAACRMVEEAAAVTGIPIGLLTRLVWTESRFRPDATSTAGAQGIAQFMPLTAAERGLADPFDPAQAIMRAAELLADLDLRFGNLGLAVAAYNAGTGRIENWLAGNSLLPRETETYVHALTGRSAQDWANGRKEAIYAEQSADRLSCVQAIISLRAKDGTKIPLPRGALAFRGNQITTIALTAFDRARQRYCRGLDPKWPKTNTVALSRRREAATGPLLPPLCATAP